MLKRKLILIMLPLLIIASGCNLAKKPAKKPQVPSIPQSISQGKGQEPILKVYEVQTKKNKRNEIRRLCSRGSGRRDGKLLAK